MTAIRAKLYEPPPEKMPEYLISRHVRAGIGGDPAPVEEKISKRLAEESGRKPEFGSFVPFSAIRVLTAGGNAGHIVGTENLTTELIPNLRSDSLIRATGIEELSIGGTGGNVTVPDTVTGFAPGFSAEGVAASESDPAYGQKFLFPKKMNGSIGYTRNFLLQAYDLESLLHSDIGGGITEGVEAALLNGSGDAGQATGILSTSGVGSVSGTDLGRTGIASAVATVGAAKVPLSGAAFVMPVAVWETLSGRETATGSGRYLIEDNRMLGFPVYISAGMPASTVLFGAFREGVKLAVWKPGLDLLTNPYSGGRSGLVSIVAHLYLDVYVRRANAFCMIVSVS